MNKFSQTLLKWYRLNRRNFPWRETKNPYYIWLSEIILQQTKTEQGLPYYLKFIKNYPTVQDLANATEQDVLKLWQGLGYYSRARNLHHTAKYITSELKGEFPKTYKDLIKLKGIGDYTASAIASICFNQKEAVLDGNVFRVLSRYFGIYTDILSTKGKKEFKELATNLLINLKDVADYNQAIMDFGAIQCTPKKTNCKDCILQDNCYAFLKKEVNLLPIKKKKNQIKKRYFNYIVFLDSENNTILQKRKNKDIWQNLHEFPLIESPNKIEYKELEEQITASKYKNFSIHSIFQYNKNEIIHKLSHQHIHTTFWIIETSQTLKKGIPFSTIKTFPVSTLTHNFIESFINS